MSASPIDEQRGGDLLADEEFARIVEARAVIERAKGILMHRYKIDAESAFAVLRRYSQDGNTKLHAIAEGLERNLRLPDDPPD